MKKENQEKRNTHPQDSKKPSYTPHDDLLNLLFHDIGKMPVLSNEETLEYFKRMHEGDEHYRKLLIMHNMRFVITKAKECCNSISALYENISAGFVGLCNAVDKYDSERGTPFVTCASAYIDKEIRNNYAINSHIVHLPDNHRKDHAKVKRFLEQCSDSPEIIDDSCEAIADGVGLSMERVKRAQLDHASYVSYDEPLSSDDGSSTTRLNLIADTSLPPADESVESKSSVEYLKAKICHIVGPKEAQLFFDHTFGDHVSARQLAERYGMTVKKMNKMLQHIRTLLVNNPDLHQYAKADGLC